MSLPQPAKRILIVDDDPAYLDMIASLIQQFRGEAWEVVTAGEAGKALTTLRQGPVSLLLVDARMPVVDGLQLIRLVRQNHAHLKIAVLTGYADETTRKTYLENGADLFFEKPRSSDGVQTLLIALDDLLQGAPERGFRGVLEQVELQDLLQIECSKRNSSRLEVLTGSERGQLFIKNGAVIHAESGDLTGEPAFYRLLSHKGGELRVRPFEEPPAVSITSSWMSLLMEWAQRRDEITTPQAEEACPPAAPTGTEAPSETPAGDSCISSHLAYPLTDSELAPLPERTEEIFVCSATGDVLYEKGCNRLAERKRLTDFLAQTGARLSAIWPVGKLEIVEFETSRGRCVAQALADVSIFVTVRTVETQAAASSHRDQ